VAVVDTLFQEIKMVVLRSLLAVQPVRATLDTATST
jgi:hypothetical protein